MLDIWFLEQKIFSKIFFWVMTFLPSFTGLLSLRNSCSMVARWSPMELGSVYFPHKSPQNNFISVDYCWALKNWRHTSSEFLENSETATHCLICHNWEWWTFVSKVPMVACSALILWCFTRWVEPENRLSRRGHYQHRFILSLYLEKPCWWSSLGERGLLG